MPILPHLKASCAFVVLFMATSSVSHGQESKPATKTTFGLPPTAFVAIRMKPQQYLHSDSATWMPIEIAQAWSDENLGLDLQSVELVTAFVGMPMGPGAPPIAIHIALSKDFDPSRINPKLLLEKQSRKIQDKEVYMLGDRNDHMMLHAINPRSMVIADPQSFQAMLRPSATPPILTKLMGQNPLEDDLQVLAAVGSLRPILAAVRLGGRDS